MAGAGDLVLTLVVEAGLSFSGDLGTFTDLAATPHPTGVVAAASGDTRRFHAWHRDAVLGQATSNFTDAVSESFR